MKAGFSQLPQSYGVYVWADRLTDRQTDRLTYIQTDIPTDKHTGR